jgi:hypothetical protein
LLLKPLPLLVLLPLVPPLLEQPQPKLPLLPKPLKPLKLPKLPKPPKPQEPGLEPEPVSPLLRWLICKHLPAVQELRWQQQGLPLDLKHSQPQVGPVLVVREFKQR